MLTQVVDRGPYQPGRQFDLTTRSPAGSGCTGSSRSTGPTRGPGETLRLKPVLDPASQHRVHVEPTPCEREPASGLGTSRPTVPHGTHLACPGSRGRGANGEVGAWWGEPRLPPLLFASTLARCRSCTAIRRAAPTGPPFGCACARPDPRRGCAGHRRRPVRPDPARSCRGRRRDAAGRRARECARSRRSRPASSRTCRGRHERRRRQRGHAAQGGPTAVGVTLRLWLDPNGPDAERACCSPSAVIAARQSCHARGLPHVTLDLRDAFRRAVVSPFVRGYARGETPNPCIRCNGGFRFAELLSFARRVGAGRSRRATTRASSSATGGCCSRAVSTRTRTRATCSPASPRLLARIRFPLGEQTKDETRARPLRPGSPRRTARRARRRAFSRATTIAPSSTVRGCLRRPARSSTKRASSSASTAATGSSRPASGVVWASRRRAAVRAVDRCPANTVVVGPRAALARTRVPPAAVYAPASASTRSSATALLPSPRASSRPHRLPAPARRTCLRRGSWPGRRPLRRRRRRRFRVDHVSRCGLGGSGGRRLHLRGSRGSRPCGVSRRGRSGDGLGVFAAGRDFRPAFVVDPGNRA